MEGQWREVVTLVFKGRQYRDHALDLRALDELPQFQIDAALSATVRF